MTIKVTTNHHWTHFLYGYELTPKEREDFDYIEDIDNHDFIRYRGMVIDPYEMFAITDTMRLHHDYGEWEGYQSDSYFSGIVIRYSVDCESYQIGTYTS